ncbi:hypothetical protein PHMEG_00015821 [Phytophthora megakarya]|uniref:DDE-1 domain-containing protein n=1 Tax=Phytophthora megakarya TaxID=4795 RepID=A0A225W0S6_9STRA|nr:hypothetical protein PHMEG_00015821 [Phytophthora megakarya]
MKRLQEQHDCQIYDNPTAWQNIEEKIVLFWDDFSHHWTTEVVAYAASINVILKNVPRGTHTSVNSWMLHGTSHLKPHYETTGLIDSKSRLLSITRRTAQRLGISALIEVTSRNEMQDVARDRVQEIRQEDPCSTFRVVPPSRDDITAWIYSSWEKLTTSTIIGGFLGWESSVTLV